jgi:hypothetical protein
LSLIVTNSSAQQKPAAANVPSFKVDPSWPLEMPNHWIMGAVTGVFVDAKQHVWVTHLPETLTEEELYEEQKPPMGTCCKAAPPVLEFDQQGKLVQGWGQGSMTDFTDWPREPHGIFVDHNDFVWVGSYNRHRVMKFTREGKHLLTIGEYEKTGGSADTHLLGGPPANICGTGAHTAMCRTIPRSSIPRRWSRARCRSSSRRRTASPDRRTARSMSPIAAATASRCSTTPASFLRRR